jgi:hypothetical protein
MIFSNIYMRIEPGRVCTYTVHEQAISRSGMSQTRWNAIPRRRGHDDQKQDRRRPRDRERAAKDAIPRSCSIRQNGRWRGASERSIGRGASERSRRKSVDFSTMSPTRQQRASAFVSIANVHHPARSVHEPGQESTQFPISHSFFSPPHVRVQALDQLKAVGIKTPACMSESIGASNPSPQS